MSESNLRAVLETLDSPARDMLRRVLIRDQADRDTISSQLLRYRDERGDDWADIIDMLTLDPEARRKVVGCSGSWRRSDSGVCDPRRPIRRSRVGLCL